MKIAAVHPYLGVRAGAAGAFIDMMSSLKKRGHQIDLYCFGANDAVRDGLLNEFPLYVEGTAELHSDLFLAKPFLIYLNNWRLHSASKRLALKINKQDYDIAFVDHNVYTPMLMPYLQIPRANYCYEPPRLVYEPSIIFGHETGLLQLMNLPLKYIDRHFTKFADLVLCNSNYVRSYIKKAYGIDAVTNYLAVDTEKYRPVEVPKENMVLCVGVIQPFKAQDFLIRSIGLIPESKRPRVVIITSGLIHDLWYRDLLIDLSRRLKVRLEIKEKYIEHEEFLRLHSQARVVAIPYIREPSIEPVALACGTPIVAVNEGGVPEAVIDKETGLLTRRNEAEFAAAIEYLLDHPGIGENMGRAGRQWVMDNFTWEQCAANLESNLLNLIERCSRRPG